MNIYLIEDHKMIADAIKSSLKSFSTIDKVTTFSSGDQFLKSGVSLNYKDIIITDLLMPGISGVEVLDAYKALAKAQSVDSIKIIVLSSVIDSHTIKMCMRHGASGYLSKSAPIEELVTAISTVVAGDNYIATHLRKSVIDNFIADEQIVFHLSPREKDVLNYVCSGHTIKETAFKMDLSVHTVKTYYKSIMKKFNVHRTADLILFAIQKGLYHPELKK